MTVRVFWDSANFLMDLSSFRVPCPVDEVFYISEFVSEEEEVYLQRKVIGISLQIEGACESVLRVMNAIFPPTLMNFEWLRCADILKVEISPRQTY
ncbi:hypothetical protein K439DRAFT_1643459 [Ramaria rubella]|nr:hypothetical protein K439DRAFT_1643459 [Ramaria rubella]